MGSIADLNKYLDTPLSRSWKKLSMWDKGLFIEILAYCLSKPRIKTRRFPLSLLETPPPRQDFKVWEISSYTGQPIKRLLIHLQLLAEAGLIIPFARLLDTHLLSQDERRNLVFTVFPELKED